MAHRRIVIDFDDEGEASGADGAGGGLLGSAHAAAADATGSSHGVLGTGSNKPADLLRSIQNMRMTLKRLEQQKQQHAAGATLAASAGSNSGGVLDKHIALQLQMERLRQEIEQKNSQLQRMPKPGIARAGTPPAPALFGAPAPLVVASSAPAGRAHLGRSISLPGASELAGGGLEQEPPPQQQQQFALSKQQQLGKQRSDVGPIAGHDERISGAPPTAKAHRLPEQQDAAEAADAFLLSLQAQNDGEPAQRPAVQEGLGPPVSANQQQELHGAASSRKDCQQQMDLPDLLPVQPPDKAAARRQPAADTLAAPRAVAAAGLVDAATAQATPARAATLSAPGAQGGPSESKAAPAAEDPASPLQQLTALPLDPQPEPGTSGRGAANAGSGGAGAAREAADGQPVAMLPVGLLQALLPAERRVGADAELATIRAQKQQALLKRQVLRQLLQDAAQAWDQLCAQERQLLRKMGHEESQAQPQEAAAALPSSVADAAGQRRRRQLAALAAAATERLQRAQLSVAAQAARHMQGGMQRRLPGAQLLKDAHGADAPAACIPPGVPTPEAGAAGPAEPALMQAVAAVGEQEALGGSGQQQVAALVHEQSVPKQAALRPLQAAASGRKRGRSRSCSESQGRCRAAPGCRRPVAATRGPSRASSSSFSSSSSYSSTSGSTSSSSSMSKSMTSSSREAPAGQKARGRAPGRPGSGASVEPQSRSGSRGLANRGDQRGRSKERGLPQTCPIVRRSPTPDAAPPAVVAAAHNGPSKSTPRSGAAAALEQSKKQGAGAAKEANGGSGAGGASRLPLRIPDSVRRLFLQGLQRCCKLWHLPFSAYRIEGQMERLKHGFVCRQELGASFSQLLLAMQREGHMQLDMSDASPSRWRVTTVPKTPGAPDRERVAAPASSRPGSRQEGAAALAPAAQPSREGGSAAAVAPPASSVPGEQQHQLQQSVPEGVDTTCAAGTAAAPIRFSIRGNSRASVGAGAATAKSGAAAAGSGAPSAAQPAALAAGGAAAPPSATPFAVLQVPSGRAPWQKLAAAKATAAASLAAATDAAPAPAAIPDGSAAGASPQPTGGGASQLPSPAADMPSVAAAESPQSSPVKPALAVASAVQAASPVPAAAADGGEGQPSPGLRRHIMRQQSAAARPDLQPQKNAPAARPLLAAAAAAAGSIKAAATAVDVARTSAAFKFAAAELQQRRQAQGAPGARVEEQARQQDQQTQQQALQGAAQQPVRVILLVSSSSAASGKEHVRLLITPHLAPPPAPPSRPQGLAQHSQLGQGPPLGLVPPAQAATSLPSVVGQPSALHASGVPPWARPAQAPAQQQPKLWQQPQRPQQQFGAQLLAAIPQHGHPADRANSAGGRQLSDYGDLAGSSVATRGTSRGAGRHLPVFASDGGPSNGAGPGRRPAMLGSPPLPPWLQGVHASYAQAPPAHATLLAQLEGCLRPRHSNVAIPASASSILGRGGLLSEAVASAVLRHEPSGGRAGGGAGAARSGVAHAAVRAPKPAPLLADWPMCPFELRGSCRDAACRFQMAADQQVLQAALSSPQRQHTQRTQEQQQAVVASEAASARRPGLAMPGATQPQPKRRRVSDSTVQAVALEQQLPVYAVSKQCAAGLGSSCTSASAARADQPFASLLLGPAVLLQLPLALSASGVSSMSAALRWQLLPGGGAVSGHMLRSQQHQQASAVSQQAQAEADAGSSGRYFGAPAAQHGSQAERERPYWQRQYDELLQQRPEDDEVWLSYAVRHAVEACSSKGCALSLALREQMLLVLKRGLEHNRHSAVLWPLYLHLYCQQPGCAAGMMVDTALQFAPHSYRLWLVAAEQQRQWQEAATVLQRGVLALCRPVLTGGSAGAGGAGVGGKSLPEPQAAAALDLGLRLLHLLSMANQPDSSSQLVQWAGGDLAGSGSLLLRSKAALLAELQPHPRLFATLCCCCAYAAAYGCLPGPAQHSLGYQQASLSELLRDWPELPGQHHQHQQAACRAALVAGADSLGLLGHSSGNLLHQERGLAAAQHGRMLESLRQAQQAQPEALCAAQSALLLAVLRLDRIAGASGPAGSSLMVQLVGFTSGMPSSQASSLAPPQQAALAVTQQRWHAFAGWAEPKLQQGPNSAGVQQSRQLGSPALQEERRVLIQPPAELVQLMQETVVAAALSAAAPSTGGNLPLLACVQGKLHPAAAAALMAAVAGGDTAGAPNSALQLLSHWSVAYEARNPSQAWPWCAQPLDSLLASSNTFPAAGITDEQLGAAAAAALQRLAAAQHAQDVEERPRRLPGPAAKDAAAIFYSCWVAVLHSLLQPCTPPAAGQRCPGLPALRAAARAWQSGGEGMQQLGQLEVAALSLLAAAAPGAAAAEAAAAAKWVRGGARQRQALLWPPPRQPGWLDPLAAAALAPPAAAAPCVPPPSLVRQLPQGLQVLLLESALPVCSPAVASAAVAAALQAAKAAAASEAAGGEQEQRSSLWRHPVLGWALPVAASALASSVPAAQPALWHQVVALAAALSPMAAAELSAAATTVHPYSLRLWQQRHHLLSATPVGAQKPAAAVEEAQQRGLALPPPWQQQPAISWNSTSP